MVILKSELRKLMTETSSRKIEPQVEVPLQRIEPPEGNSSKKVDGETEASKKVKDGWFKGKKKYIIESVTPQDELTPQVDMNQLPREVHGENPSGAAKKVFTRVRKVTPIGDVMVNYLITLVEEPPSKGKGRFSYSAKKIQLDQPKERIIDSKKSGKRSTIPLIFEYPVKAVKDLEKTKATPKKKAAVKSAPKEKTHIELDRYKKALETPIPDDEPEHDEKSDEEQPKKAPKGAPKASLRGKA